jgi:hypothetical protein
MEQSSENPNKKYVEFETKYTSEASLETRFKHHVMNTCEVKDFLYCEGPDEYFTNVKTKRFKRFRHATFPKGLRKEVTTKVKPEGAKTSISRTEKNLRVTDNDDQLIRETILDDGFEHDFTIWKSCHIYMVPEGTIVYYCVVDITPGTKFNEEYFIEIEVDEDLIDRITTDDAKAIIRKYEEILAPLGVSFQKRLRQNLYERYTRLGK